MRRCMAEGLVGGEGFAVDASLIAADANKQRSVPAHEWSLEDLPANATRAVKDYLAKLDDAAFGAASEVRPKFVSPSDPAAQLTGALRGPASLPMPTIIWSTPTTRDHRRCRSDPRHPSGRGWSGTRHDRSRDRPL